MHGLVLKKDEVRSSVQGKHLFSPVQPSCDQKDLVWHHGEPNDENGAEDCLHFWTRSDGNYEYINDIECWRRHWFICEKDGGCDTIA
ncbi:hypothetical protein KIN20_020822 [Parelaphostrongylus tenuis]|uniref:C-type lectin domain-containing protein n=1 Tax=Parelaphostrongylus tenuis TaxID=148309 RepID=A0AAD5N6D8_PARTN|nr:hypothetical protein KIN20_020822 [Parelaphostrongylus tenuis]